MFGFVLKMCRNTGKWWSETAKPKIKKNGADLIAVGLLLSGSLLMAASDPVITGIITALSIGTSIYFDYAHVQGKKELLDKKKKQITLEVSAPSRNLELTKNISTGISASFLLGYTIFFTLNSEVTEKSYGLQIMEYISTIFAVSSCHIGRKIYDSLVTRELQKLETENDEMLRVLRENLGVSNLAMLEQYVREEQDFKSHHKLLIRQLQNFAEKIKHTKIVTMEETTEVLSCLLMENKTMPESQSTQETTKNSDALAESELPQSVGRGNGITFFSRVSVNLGDTANSSLSPLLKPLEHHP